MTDKTLLQMAKSNSMLDQAALKEVLDYDPEAGDFRWKKTRGSNAQAGWIAGSRDVKGYWLIGINGRNFRAHRVAWVWFYGTPPKYFIDHINGVKTDNRICNLRDVPRALNRQNQRVTRSDNALGLMGVRLNRTKTGYESRLKLNGRFIALGTYKTADEAHKAYLDAKRSLHVACTL